MTKTTFGVVAYIVSEPKTMQSEANRTVTDSPTVASASLPMIFVESITFSATQTIVSNREPIVDGRNVGN